MRESCGKGARGVISILLSIVLLPFFSIGALLVETSRYTAAVEALESTMGLSSLSALATYDGYLLERFGLLATGQENSLETVYQSYFTPNLPAGTFSASSSTVSGLSPLSDTSVLFRQVLEAGKLAAPTQLLTDTLDIEALIEKLEEFMHVGEVAEGLDTAAGTVDAYATLGEDVTAFMEFLVEELKPQKNDYDLKYQEWRACVSDLAGILEAIEDAQNDENADYSYLSYLHSARSDAEDAADLARKAYTQATEAWYGLLHDYNDHTQKIHEDLEEIQGKLKEVTQLGVGLAGKGEGDEIKTAYQGMGDSLAASGNMGEAMVSALNKLKFGEQDALMNSQIELLQQQVRDVNAYLINSSSELPAEYNKYYMEVTFIPSEKINDILTRQDQHMTQSKGFWAAMKGMAAAAETLFSIQGIYDPSLCAVVPEGGAPSDTYKMMAGLGTGITELRNAAKSMENGVGGWIAALKSIVKAINGFISFFEALFSRIAQIADNILNMSFEGLLFNLCLMYNLPDRTTYASGTSLTGYDFSDRAWPRGLGAVAGGSLADIASVAGGSVGATATCFVGAELEYLIEGTPSEITNQALAFADLYFLRLFLDVIPIFMDNEVKAMASVANAVGLGWLVYLAEILLEPLAETVLLVNGEKVDLLCNPVYLTPSGAPKLLDKLINADSLKPSDSDDSSPPSPSPIELSQEDANKLTEDLEGLGKITGDPAFSPDDTPFAKEYITGLREFNYTEHLFLVLIIIGNRDESLQRLQHLITMEAQSNYFNENVVGVTFDLTRSYTMLEAKGSGTVSQLLPIPALSSRSLLSMERTLYRGY